MDHFLDRERFEARFATIQTADSARSKPDPEMIQRALGETGVPANRAVIVGDTTYDIEMGRAAGVHSIGVAWGYHDTALLHAAGASFIAETFEDVLSRIAAEFSLGAVPDV